jgi:hypothetical protein
VYESAAKALIHEAKQHRKQLKKEVFKIHFHPQVKLVSSLQLLPSKAADRLGMSKLFDREVHPTIAMPESHPSTPGTQWVLTTGWISSSNNSTHRNLGAAELEVLAMSGHNWNSSTKGGQKKIKEKEEKETQGPSCTANTRSCRLKFLSHTNGS